jgi:hypothetical protein
MSLRWMLLLAAELGLIGTGALEIGTARAYAADAISAPAVAAPAAVSPVQPIARSPKQMRDAVAETLRRANAAKGNDLGAAVKSLLDVYRDLVRDTQLPVKERSRLGLQVRARLQRFANQFRYEANQTTTGRPNDSVAVQQAENGPAIAGGAGVGGGEAARGGAFGGGAFGGNDAFEKAANANGADLVDLIQKTIDPPSWEVNGGVGSIVYFNNLRVLVVRQTADGQEDIGGVLGGLRQH